MRIAILAPIWESIPPAGYGGAEQIVASLTDGLVERGHDVTLFATGESKTNAKLSSIIDSRLSGKEKLEPNDWVYSGLANIQACIAKADQFDLIHSHAGPLALPFSSYSSVPMVVTIHSLIRPDQEIVYKNASTPKYISISDSYRSVNPQVEYFETVYNGTDVSKLDFNPTPSNHFINIGRMVKTKGFKEAIELTKKAGVDIQIAAPIPSDGQAAPWLYDKSYWENEVKPLVNNDNVKFIGEISAEEKSKFFGEAKGLVFPLQWDEPFGLTVIEAMACGTPVITYDRGAMKELVKHGETGFVIKPNDEAAFIDAINNIGSISRERCRQWVEEMFTINKMVDRYEAVYKKLTEDNV